MIDDLPPLPETLRPDPNIGHHCPRVLTSKSRRRWDGPTLAEQFDRDNPSFLGDHLTWVLGVIPLREARQTLHSWRLGKVVSEDLDDELRTLLWQREMIEAGSSEP